MLGSLFSKVAGLKVCNILKNKPQHRYFDHVLSIPEYDLEKHYLLPILMKNLDKELHK